MPAQIKILKTPEGHHFEFIALNGDKMLTSITFPSLPGCKLELNEFRGYCLKPTHLDKIDSPGQQFSFVVRSTNDEIIATSLPFGSAASRDYAMEVMKRACPDAVVVVNSM